MKRKLLLGVLLFAGISSAYALTKNFNIDTAKFSISSNSKETNVTSEFADDYKLAYKIESSNDELKTKIIELSKKVTFLLLGDGDTSYETAEEYYNRHKEFFNLRYNPTVPKDENSFTGLDQDSQEYKDDVVSNLSLTSVFNQVDELNITYSTIGPIRVQVTEDQIISMVSLPKVTMKKENPKNPQEYISEETDIVMYYFFKELDGEYKLSFIFGKTTNDLSKYFNDLETSEYTNALSVSKAYDSELSNVYDFSKLESLDDNIINAVYNNNYQNLVILNGYYDVGVPTSANGFLISDGLVVTTWNFVEKSLVEAQFIAASNSDGVIYDIDGIVTADPENDIAVIKLKDKIPTTTSIGTVNEIEVEDPVISINSKTGLGVTVQTGIITSKDGYIQTSIPLQGNEDGSPVYNTEGKVIGMNTSKLINSSMSMAIEAEALTEIKNKFSNIDFSSIKFVTFDELKEKYYYTKYSDEKVVNSISSSKWKKFKKIGKIEETLDMELTKASYDNNVVSLRYYNPISEFITGMQRASFFRAELIKEGFKETLNTKTKCIYKNNNYEVIIMEEFDYVIVVMVKL